MKRLISTSAVLLMMVVAVLPALAQDEPTPTPTPGGLLIPTSTPESSGLTIPTSTPEGLQVPTSTPSGPSLPPLTIEQILALNLQPGDMPAGFDWTQSRDTFDVLGAIQVAREDGRTEDADRLQAAVDNYGWRSSDGYSYYLWTQCPDIVPNIPIIDIMSTVSQLASPERARVFIADPFVLDLAFGGEGERTPTDGVHGWTASSDAPYAFCFTSEKVYAYLFEYWGMIVGFRVRTNADTDPALVQDIFNRLTAIVVARIDALSPAPFPPTPTPALALATMMPTQQTPLGAVTLTIENNSVFNLRALYTRPAAGVAAWGESVLGEGVSILANTTTSIALEPGTYDLKAAGYDEGANYAVAQYENVDLTQDTTWAITFVQVTASNDSPSPIMELYVSPSQSDYWGENWAAPASIQPGFATRVFVNPGTYDLQALDERGNVVSEGFAIQIDTNIEWTIQGVAAPTPTALPSAIGLTIINDTDFMICVINVTDIYGNWVSEVLKGSFIAPRTRVFFDEATIPGRWGLYAYDCSLNLIYSEQVTVTGLSYTWTIR